MAPDSEFWIPPFGGIRNSERTSTVEITGNIMSVVYIALPAVLLLALAGVIAFIWAVRSGQMDDLETPGLRVLIEEDDPVATAPRDEAPAKASEPRSSCSDNSEPQ